ncbi:MAG: LPS export ABC transporter periplasmic protein LptC [Candidatus Margulisiibacteriota bacterium]
MFKKVFASFVLILVLWLFYWALFVPKESLTGRISRELERQSSKLDLFMKGVVFSEIIEGKKYWEIKALTSQINKDTGKSLMNDVQGIFFSNGKPSIRFAAPSVVWDMKERQIKIDSPKGFDGSYNFSIPDLTWALNRDIFWTDGPVVFESGQGTIKGRGLSGSPGKSGMTIKGNPVASFTRGKSSLILRAQSFGLDGTRGDITAAGGCTASMDALFITAEEMKYFRSKTEIVARGKVKITFRDIRASSDSALFRLGGNIVILSGNAAASRQGSRMSAGSLKIDMKNNRIVMKERTEVFIDDN